MNTVIVIHTIQKEDQTETNLMRPNKFFSLQKTNNYIFYLWCVLSYDIRISRYSVNLLSSSNDMLAALSPDLTRQILPAQRIVIQT